MSVIVEFTIDRNGLALGRALSGAGDSHIELEKIVPTEDTFLPFFWINYPDKGDLELSVIESHYMKNFVALDTVGDQTLFKAEWISEHEDLLKGLVETEGTILEASSNGDWQFIVRFTDHDHVGQFYNFCTDHDIPIHIERTYTLTEEALRGRMFRLTNDQREAIVLAVKRGYFKTPREVTMEELADELGITQQSFSARLRPGLDKVLDNLFL